MPRHTIIISLLCLSACAATDGFDDAEWLAISELSPKPELAPDPTNRYADDPAAAALGKQLFFERRYSGALTVGDDGENGGLGAEGENGKVSCASCHDPQARFMDTRSQPGNVSLGAGFTTRNAPSLVNSSYYEWFGWAGKQDSQWTQASLSPESSDNTAGNRCGYAHMLWDHYRDEYAAVFGVELPAALDPAAPDAARFPAKCKPKKEETDPDGAWEMMTDEDRHAINTIMANQGKAVAAFERLLIDGDSAFDRYVAGDDEAIGDAAKRGLALFIGKAACNACHGGGMLTDQEFHNLGVPQEGPNVPAMDNGRYDDLAKAKKHTFNSGSEYSDDPAHGQERLAELEPTDEDMGAFRTKGLRNVAVTGPYEHTGGKATLREVVEFYDAGGGTPMVGTRDDLLVPLNLTDGEIDDIVAFLETLTGDPLPDDLIAPPLLPD